MKVKLYGCDDVTTVEIEVNELERAFLDRLREAVEEESRSDCQPVIRYDEETDYAPRRRR